MDELKTRLSQFFESFSPTLDLLDDLIRSRSHPQEIIILTCSRLDALASTATPPEAPKRDSFVKFVCAYGQDRDFFNRVSVSNLYRDISRYEWLLAEGLLLQSGRMYRFSQGDDDMVQFIDYSDVPLTEEWLGRMLRTILRVLQSRFRVKPGQPLQKSPMADVDLVAESITAAVKRSRCRGFAETISEAVKPLIRTKVIARILYEEFRSEVIHSGQVVIDEERFFVEARPYWGAFEHPNLGQCLFVEFPALYLRNLLANCIKTYRHHLVAKGVVPAGIHWQVFRGDNIEKLKYMDPDTLGEYGVARFKLSRR